MVPGDDALRPRKLLARHVALTGSAQAKTILAHWEAYRSARVSLRAGGSVH